MAQHFLFKVIFFELRTFRGKMNREWERLYKKSMLALGQNSKAEKGNQNEWVPVGVVPRVLTMIALQAQGPEFRSLALR